MGMRAVKEVWDTLKKIHQGNNHTRVQSLLINFIKFRLDTTINKGALKLTHIQSKIRMLSITLKPSDVIKIKTLLASPGQSTK
jgi:translation initiation factor IF-1